MKIQRTIKRVYVVDVSADELREFAEEWDSCACPASIEKLLKNSDFLSELADSKIDSLDTFLGTNHDFEDSTIILENGE
jgi:predicted nucleic-acid-binding protein